jgi:hypothetical protein
MLLSIDIAIKANDITSPGAGFEIATNRVASLFPDGFQMPLPLQGKDEIADKLMDILKEWLN